MRRGIALVAAFGAALACSVVTTYDGFTGATSCGGQIPARPTGAGGDDGKKYFGALSYLSFFPDTPNAITGYDLDGRCTCHPDKGSCKGPLGNGKPCDPEGSGVDNEGGKVLSQIFQGADAGAPPGYGVAVRVSNYNGGPDDSEVLVELYNVVKVTGADGTDPTATNGPYQVTVADDKVNLD